MPEDYHLSIGSHDPRVSKERCAMEWVAFIANEPHTDRPECVSVQMRTVMMALNDGLSNEPRQKLRPYLVRCIGTAEDGLDMLRQPIIRAMNTEMRNQLLRLPSSEVWVEGPRPQNGYMDRFSNRIFGEDGWLERMLPLVPWPSAEIRRARVALERRRRIAEFVKPATLADPFSMAIMQHQPLPEVAAKAGDLMALLEKEIAKELAALS